MLNSLNPLSGYVPLPEVTSRKTGSRNLDLRVFRKRVSPRFRIAALRILVSEPWTIVRLKRRSLHKRKITEEMMDREMEQGRAIDSGIFGGEISRGPAI